MSAFAFDRLVDFLERLRFDLDRQVGTCLTHEGNGARHASGQTDVIVLDEHRIEETDAVIGRAASGDGVFLQRAQRRRRLSRVENRDAAGSGVDESSCGASQYRTTAGGS